MTTDFTTHVKAAQLSDLAYLPGGLPLPKDGLNGEQVLAKMGYERVAKDDDSKTFAAFAYLDLATGKTHVTIRGTNNIHNILGIDRAIALQTWHSDFDRAVKFILTVKNDRRVNPNNMFLAGHSAGGTTQQTMSKLFGIPGIGVDSPGAKGIAQRAEFKAWAVKLGKNPLTLPEPDFTTYMVNGSAISKVGEQMGRVQQLPSVFPKATQFGKLAIFFAAAMLFSPLFAVAGVANNFATSQIENHESEQAGQVMRLMARAMQACPDLFSGDTHWVNAQTMELDRNFNWEIHSLPGVIEVRNSDNILQATLKFTGNADTRKLEVYDPTNSLKATLQANRDQIMLLPTMPAPIVDASTQLVPGVNLININTNTELSVGQTQTPDENALLESVGLGYLTKNSAYWIGFSLEEGKSILDRNDYASTTASAIASGGIRPGEMTLDTNAKPQDIITKQGLEGVASGQVKVTNQTEAAQPTTSNENNPAALQAQALADAALNQYAGLNNMVSGNQQRTYIDPLILALNPSKRVSLTDFSQSVLFDTDHSGSLKQTGWFDARDGMVVHDLNGNGRIDDVSETLSEFYKGQVGQHGQAGEKQFKNGFAALATLDRDAQGQTDGVFNAKDLAWRALRVWVDANHNAKTDAGELHTFEALGITQIELANQAQSGEIRDGNEILSHGSFIQNGESREALAVNFLANPASHHLTQKGQGFLIETEVTQASDNAFPGVAASKTPTKTSSYASQNIKGELMDAATLGVTHLYGNTGDDTLIASEKGSWLIGGGGHNRYQGKAGDDVFVITADDVARNNVGRRQVSSKTFLAA